MCSMPGKVLPVSASNMENAVWLTDYQGGEKKGDPLELYWDVPAALFLFRNAAPRIARVRWLGKGVGEGQFQMEDMHFFSLCMWHLSSMSAAPGPCPCAHLQSFGGDAMDREHTFFSPLC